MSEKNYLLHRTLATACMLFVSTSGMCDNQANVVLEQGDKAPFQGILISPDTAQKLDNDKIQLGSCSFQNDLLNKEQAVLMQRTQNANNEVDTLSSQLQSARSGSFWEKTGMFVLGVAVTGLISYGAHRTAH